MKITKIRLKNLNSLQDEVVLDFNKEPLSNTGLFAITGDTGAGKTTLLDAITLALYGSIHRSASVLEVMAHGTTECFAEAEFETASGEYRAKWSLHRARGKVDGNIQPVRRELSKRNTQTNTYEFIAQKVGEINAKIEEISGLDYARFTRSVLLGQGDFAAFLKAGENERSDLLERITGTEIYSQIGADAYKRFKLESVKLEALQKQLSDIQILTDEEVEHERQMHQQLEAKATSIQNELTDLEKKNAWLQEVALKSTQLEVLIQNQTQVQAAITAASADLTRLKNHKLVVPIAPDIRGRMVLIEEKKVLLQAINNLEQGLEEKEKKKKDWVEKQELLRNILAERETMLHETEKKAEQVLPLDERILLSEKKVAEQEEAEKVLLNDNAQLLEEHSAEKKHQQENQIKTEKIEEWLDKHKHFEGLEERLPEIDRQVNLLIQATSALKSGDNLQTQIAEEKNKLENRLGKAVESDAAYQNQLAQYDESFSNLAGNHAGGSRSERMEYHRQSQETINQDLEDTKASVQVINRWLELKRKLIHLESLKEKTATEIQDCRKSKEELQEKLGEISARLEDKKTIFFQQQTIANYEKDRAVLKPGDPCPLCLSTEHPYRKHPPLPNVDQAKEDYDAVVAEEGSLQRKGAEIENSLAVLLSRMQRLSGAEDGAFEDSIPKVREELALLQLPPEINLDSTTDSFAPVEYYLQVLKEERLPALEARKQETFQLVRELENLNGLLEDIIPKAGKAREECIQLQGKLEAIEERLIGLKEANADWRKKAEVAHGMLQNHLTPLRLVPAFEDLEAQRDHLYKMRDTIRKGKQALGECRQEDRLIRQRLENLENNREASLNKLSLIGKGKAALLDELNQDKQLRKELFGEKNPKMEISRVRGLLNSVKKEQEEHVIQLQDLEKEWVEASTRISVLTSQLAEKDQSLNQLALKLDRWIGNSSFSSLEEAEIALLPEAEVDELDKKAIELDEARKKAENACQLKQAELNQLLGARITDQSPEAIQEQLQESRHLMNEALQEIGRIKERLDNQDRQVKRAGSLTTEIQAQQAELRRWNNLTRIIGSSTGDVFRRFAQGLTLTQLVLLANRYLDKLSGRYFIRKKEGDSLDLIIVDSYQANNQRPMNTLSGGESFLVSLALALGLSDFASRRTRISSLFIDEGFGSLDENTLDEAISTLENLQAEGKIIGIISHVEALKERISTQVRVVKKGNGVSAVMLV